MAHVHEFKVTMTCEGCSGAVERILGKHKDKGIENVQINLKEQQVLVTTAMTADEVLQLIKKSGKAVEFIKTT